MTKYFLFLSDMVSVSSGKVYTRNNLDLNKSFKDAGILVLNSQMHHDDETVVVKVEASISDIILLLASFDYTTTEIAGSIIEAE